MIPLELASSAGLDSLRLNRAFDLLDRAVSDGRLPGGAIAVSRHGSAVEPHVFGVRDPFRDSEPVSRDTLFLVASVTKPVTVCAVMLLVERGLVLLEDPVCRHVPEFAANGKEGVCVRHLMTHTSGLPDMTPSNAELRRNHAPFSEFIREICSLPLGFPPGTSISYQSCGTAMLAEIVARVTGKPARDFLRDEVYEPLGMRSSSLGIVQERAHRVAPVNVGADMRDTDWGWNSDYWRNFGAPWGGMFSTVGDLQRLLQTFLSGGSLDGVSVFSPATVAAMTTDHSSQYPLIPPETRAANRWGLGWNLAANGCLFGDLVSRRTFGHAGATGTLVWADAERELTCVIFTTEPFDRSQPLLTRCSNLVAASAL